ncbi:hypothetical protein GHT06_020216 [Daphnia sinensis]|uniref:Uncharacterized protein n=1 Tax=Daphnia sinensis TaxID=1820382 RepID=A0AAD5L2R1_9CRUS|nr:hypothetical protein GHT06_020216 [Daphnia sinensis]
MGLNEIALLSSIQHFYFFGKRKIAYNKQIALNSIQYVSIAKSKDTVIRVGKAVLISDSLSIMQTLVIKSLTASVDRRAAGHPKAQCQLHPDCEVGQFSSEKRPYEDIDQELAETDVKIVKLEQDNRQLKQNVLALQEEISAFKEDPVQLLTASDFPPLHYSCS